MGRHDDAHAADSKRFCSVFPGVCIGWLQFICGANPSNGGNLDPALLPRIMDFLPRCVTAHP
jgi:hypothetical protein